VTLIAVHAREACLEEPTVQVPVHDAIDKSAPEPIDPLETPLPQLLQALYLLVACLHETVQGCLPGIPGPVEAD
jgi:hypothetical protein